VESSRRIPRRQSVFPMEHSTGIDLVGAICHSNRCCQSHRIDALEVWIDPMCEWDRDCGRFQWNSTEVHGRIIPMQPVLRVLSVLSATAVDAAAALDHHSRFGPICGPDADPDPSCRRGVLQNEGHLPMVRDTDRSRSRTAWSLLSHVLQKPLCFCQVDRRFELFLACAGCLCPAARDLHVC